MTLRYTPNRKHAILRAIATGKLDRAEVMAEHGVSEGEMREWERDYPGGVNALRVTRRAVC